ncbi:hypothetical protein RYH73_26025 [Olivibacter sp. CPCC 100613]|uniref:hypothetical protein n=1 Tax=Olivibacter sp. CPCC 100613 TaxID=3079931 RepID=UPI002FF8BA26
MRNLIEKRKKSRILIYFQAIFISIAYSACDKADYLDIDASERPPLSAKVKLVNVLSKNVPVHFWDFTRQINSDALTPNTASEDYLDTQYGKVQFNLTEGESTTYKASYLFGGSANFIQETDKNSFSGPNGPIATFYHSLFAVQKKSISKLNPGNIDSLILVYDDLSAPAADKIKIRFANFDINHARVSVLNSKGETLFTDVDYGTFGDQVKITYDENGKSAGDVPGLDWKSLGPFKEVDTQDLHTITIIDELGRDLDVTAFANLSITSGKIYTLFISKDFQSNRIIGTVISH